MNTPWITHKITPTALQLLRLIAAYTDEKQFAILERLLREELHKVQKAYEEKEPQ